MSHLCTSLRYHGVQDGELLALHMSVLLLAESKQDFAVNHARGNPGEWVPVSLRQEGNPGTNKEVHKLLRCVRDFLAVQRTCFGKCGASEEDIIWPSFVVWRRMRMGR